LLHDRNVLLAELQEHALQRPQVARHLPLLSLPLQALLLVQLELLGGAILLLLLERLDFLAGLLLGRRKLHRQLAESQGPPH